MKPVSTSLLVLLCAMAAGAAAQDPQAGKTLHQSHCVACHASLTQGEPDRMYTREDRRIQSQPALVAQVRRCEQALELRWFDEDVHNVAAWLDRTFYKF